MDDSLSSTDEEDAEFAALFEAEKRGLPASSIGTNPSLGVSAGAGAVPAPAARAAGPPEGEKARASASGGAPAAAAAAPSGGASKRRRISDEDHRGTTAGSGSGSGSGAAAAAPTFDLGPSLQGQTSVLKRARPAQPAPVPPPLPPRPWQLTMVKGISSEANRGSPRLRSLLSLPDMSDAVLSNYMYEMSWLLGECPYLRDLRRFTIIHGARDAGTVAHYEETKPPNAVLHQPRLPIIYGTMHSKAALIFSPTKLRLLITTANFIRVDFSFKSQGVWTQDFPLKEPGAYEAGRSSGAFEESLIDYFGVVGGFDVDSLRKFDFRGARGQLVASVPGYHRGEALEKWGHMRLRALLRSVHAPPKFDSVACQFSSMGKVSEKWMRQDWLPTIGTAAVGLGSASQPPPKVQLVIPTEQEVKNSIQGWYSGDAIPIRADCHKPWMRSWPEPPAYTSQGFAVGYGDATDLYHRWSSGSSASTGTTGLDDGCSGRSRASASTLLHFLVRRSTLRSQRLCPRRCDAAHENLHAICSGHRARCACGAVLGVRDEPQLGTIAVGRAAESLDAADDPIVRAWHPHHTVRAPVLLKRF